MIQKTLVFGSEEDMEETTQKILDRFCHDESHDSCGKDMEECDDCIDEKVDPYHHFDVVGNFPPERIIKRPKAPAGFIAFKWKTKQQYGCSVNICPGCKKFDGYCNITGLSHGWQDKTAMALYRHSVRKGISRKKERNGWSDMLVEIDGDNLVSHWSRYGMQICLGCKMEFWHDFGGNQGQWQYYYKPKGQEVLK